MLWDLSFEGYSWYKHLFILIVIVVNRTEINTQYSVRLISLNAKKLIILHIGRHKHPKKSRFEVWIYAYNNT